MFVGTLYWYLHLSSEGDVAIDGVHFGKTTGAKIDGRDLGDFRRSDEDVESGHSKKTEGVPSS